jgi:hemin uptake protein HemP
MNVTMPQNDLTSDQPEPVASNRSDPPHTISSEELLQGRRELWIEHEGQMYRLRVTSRGKLYLTK